MIMIITRAGSPDSVCLRWPTGQMCSRPRWSLLYLCHGHHIIKFTIIKCDHQPSVNIHFTTSLCPIVPMGPDPVNVCVSQCFILHCVCSKTIHMSQHSSSYCVNRWCDQSFVFGSKSSCSFTFSFSRSRKKLWKCKVLFLSVQQSTTKKSVLTLHLPSYPLLLGRHLLHFEPFNGIKSNLRRIKSIQTHPGDEDRHHGKQIRGTNASKSGEPIQIRGEANWYKQLCMYHLTF